MPWLEPLLVLGLPLPAGLGTASLHGACRAVWALLPAGLRDVCELSVLSGCSSGPVAAPGVTSGGRWQVGSQCHCW